MSRLPKTPALAVVLFVAVVYSAWIGARWLSAGYSSVEIPVFASRVWEIQSELARSGSFPWWSRWFMSGSSEALVDSGGFLMVPWLLLARPFGLIAAGKVVSLLAIAASGVAMFLCARRLLKNETAAVLSSFAYLLHPLLLARSIGTEHINVVVFIPLVPLVWLTLDRALEKRRVGASALAAIALSCALFAQNKQTAVLVPFLAAFSLWRAARAGRSEWIAYARTLGLVALLALLLSAFVLVPPLLEARQFKMWAGDPLEAWQRMYALHGIASIVHRSADETNYAGVVLLACVVVAGLGRRRKDPLFGFLAAELVVAAALGHGRDSMAVALAESWTGADAGTGPLPAGLVMTSVIAAVAILVLVWRQYWKTARARWAAAVVGGLVLFVPWCRLVLALPLYRDIRAPEVFWQVPGAFLASILVGFLARDVRAVRLRRRRAPIIAILGALFVFDALPYQDLIAANAVPAQTIEHAERAYAAMGAEAPNDPGKAYVVTSRPLYLMGPSWGGPTLVSGTPLDHMMPRGTGRLATASNESAMLKRAYLDLMGVRWIVVDKTDPRTAGSSLTAELNVWKKVFPTFREDDDFLVLRVPTSRPFVSGYPRAAISFGNPDRLPELAIALENEGYVLVDTDVPIETVPPADLVRYAAIYVPSFARNVTDPSLLDKMVILGESQPRLPERKPRDEAIVGLTVERSSAEHIVARFDAVASCTAVIAESVYPYWKAELDGTPVPLLRAAYGLMGVPVSAGHHELVLRYRTPAAYAWSVWVSLAALLLLISLAIRCA